MGKVRNALLSAADWLEANPDKHIASFLSVDKNGKTVPPTSKNAVCFCGVGRVCKELDLNLKRRESIFDSLHNLFEEEANQTIYFHTADKIVTANDRGGRPREMFCRKMSPASVTAIRVLRQLANRLPE